MTADDWDKALDKAATAMRQLGTAASRNLDRCVARTVTFADIKDHAHGRGFLFVHVTDPIPGRVDVLVVSVEVDGKPDPQMVLAETALVEDLEDRRSDVIDIRVDHHSVTTQQLAALQSLVRLVGPDEACAQIFGFGVQHCRKLVGAGQNTREETDAEFTARIQEERKGLL